MKLEKDKRQAVLSWAAVVALFVLCGVLGVLQYRWIGEVSVAARERLRGSLRASLNRVSQDFNSELGAAGTALLPTVPVNDAAAAETAVTERYRQSKSGRSGQLFRRIAIAAPQKGTVVLHVLDPETGGFEAAPWPAEWASVKERIESRVAARDGNPMGEPPFFGGRGPGEEESALELPIMGPPAAPGSPAPFGRREAAWLLLDLNLRYVREVMLPEILQRHLEAGGTLAYQVEVVTKTSPPAVIYQSDPEAGRIAASADASVNLCEMQSDFFRRGPSPGMRKGGPGPGRGGGSGADMGRWEMFVRNRAGSLEAVVSQARWRNLSVTLGVLLLLIATVAALVRFTRRAQKLAELQMEFVAGVSHELRTPLTVIYTAGYSLQGKIAHNPTQVEKYGALIQQESGRLKDLVEQVLRFASATAGRVIQEPEPLSIESLIEDTVESSKAVIQGAHCVVEKSIDPQLPMVMGDPMSLKHALQNLVSNAAKYGSEGSNWIGISASSSGTAEQPEVEIRVADRGPGIPREEQEHIFDPFYRGRRAVRDQVHGTGLGLNLARKIVEAHGGSIRVKSEPMKGTEFILRIPAVPAGASG